MRRTAGMAGVVAMLLLIGAADDPARDPVLPAWMAGCWVEEQGDRWTEECWTAPRGGIMLGSGRSGRGERLGSWETMQIVLGDDATNARMAFCGAPRGQGRTAFTWAGAEGDGVTFINAAHDYPQRIRYWREGEELIAETALGDGGKAMRWRYRRQGAMPSR
ncbi:DUF6265 family protein [Sphingomonas sp.]|uniref:DUF6265 family protein n=1 Tax=Sphingomonas sp. TaxID=28214 RepID=UPI002B586737|nr:DUF6265 family protein [Sphingomonas sp.]HWK35672.1 DUF6265 family protein [Sphingomonas sp.]